MRVKLFPNFTRHHLITHTNIETGFLYEMIYKVLCHTTMSNIFIFLVLFLLQFCPHVYTDGDIQDACFTCVYNVNLITGYQRIQFASMYY